MSEDNMFSPSLDREGMGRVSGTVGVSTPTLPLPFPGEGQVS